MVRQQNGAVRVSNRTGASGASGGYVLLLFFLHHLFPDIIFFPNNIFRTTFSCQHFPATFSWQHDFFFLTTFIFSGQLLYFFLDIFFLFWQITYPIFPDINFSPNNFRACVSCYFPISNRPEVRFDNAVAALKDDKGTPVSMRIWVIDDDSYVSEFLKIALRGQGYDVDSFLSHAEVRARMGMIWRKEGERVFFFL